MNIESNLSGHWTDEQLIDHLYGIGPDQDHMATCESCSQRLSAMMAARRAVESESSPLEQVPFELLAAQRRSIYSRLGSLSRWHVGLQLRRWAAAGAMVALLGGGVALYQQNHHKQAEQSKISDAQLAAQVSQIADDSEPAATQPLQALFAD